MVYKIAIVSTFDSLCGSAICLNLLMSKLKKDKNYTFKIFAEDKIPYINRITTEKGVEYNHSWSRLDKDFNRLYKSLKEYEPQLVHFVHEANFFGVDNKLVTLTEKLKKSSKVLLQMESPIVQYLDYFKSLNLDGYLSTHYPQEKQVYKDLGFPGKCFYIDRAVRQTKVLDKKEARKELDITSAHVLITTGFVRRSTGLPYFMRILQGLKGRVPDILLIVAGDMHYDDGSNKFLFEGETLVKKFLLKDKVIFTKKVHSNEELNLYGSASDIYVSYRKDFPFFLTGGSIYRGIEFELPIIAFNCPGVSSIPKGIIRVINEGDAVNVITNLFRDPKEHAKFVYETRELKKKLSVAKIASKYSKMYMELLE